MRRLFEVKFLEDAIEFLSKVDPKAARKIIYNIDKASYIQDPELLKKLSGDIWNSGLDLVINSTECLRSGINVIREIR